MTEVPRSAYEVLGVAPDATPAEIRAAYRRRSLELHPDRASEDASTRAGDSMRELNEAWRQLQSGLRTGTGSHPAPEGPGPPKWQPSAPGGQRRLGCAWIAAVGAVALVAGIIAVIAASASGRSSTAPPPSTIPPATVSVVCRDLRTRSVANLAQVYWSEDPSHSVAQYAEAIEATARQGCPSEL